jgi:hypothetical protein
LQEKLKQTEDLVKQAANIPNASQKAPVNNIKNEFPVEASMLDELMKNMIRMKQDSDDSEMKFDGNFMDEDNDDGEILDDEVNPELIR